MENYTKDISAFPIISFLVIVLMLYVLLKLIGNVVPYIIKRKKLKSAFKRNYSIVELFIWIVFLLRVIPFFMKMNMAYGVFFIIMVVIIMLMVSWYAGRDFIAGFILRANTGYKPTAQIKMGDYEGVIMNRFPRNLKLLDDKGEKLLIPYSLLIGKSIVFKSLNKSRISTHIKLKIQSDLDFDRLTEQLKFKIMTHPKALLTEYPIINLILQKDKELELDIILYARDNEGLSEIEYSLKEFAKEL